MKKTYINPALKAVVTSTECFIAESLTIAGGTSTLGQEEEIVGDVKTSSYSVWSDDWSK